MLGNPSARAEAGCTRRKNAEKNNEKLDKICMPACMLGNPSAGSRLYLRKNAEKLAKNM